MAPLAQAKVANCDPTLKLTFGQMDAQSRTTMYNNMQKTGGFRSATKAGLGTWTASFSAAVT